MNEVYVIKDTEAKDEDCYVDIDRRSGGYPFLRPIIDAHKFYSKKRAIEYMETFHKEKWVLQKFICYATDCAMGNVAKAKNEITITFKAVKTTKNTITISTEHPYLIDWVTPQKHRSLYYFLDRLISYGKKKSKLSSKLT